MDLFPHGFLDRMHWLQTLPGCFFHELALDGDVQEAAPAELLVAPALGRNAIIGLQAPPDAFLGAETLRPATLARVVEMPGSVLMERLAASPFARGMRWENARDEFLRDVIQLSLHLKQHHPEGILRLRGEGSEVLLYPAASGRRAAEISETGLRIE